MAVEAKRGCGYRKVGGLYLCGTGLAVPCDRLPLPIEPCPVCGSEPRFTRSISRIDPLRLWGNHDPCVDTNCPVCQPPPKGFLVWVGKEYTPKSFVQEALTLGISKRIHAIPTDLQLGEDWVFCAYLKLIPKNNHTFTLPFGDDHERRHAFTPGIFYAFRPQRLELVVTETQAKDEQRMAELREKGITPIAVPDDDPDHRGSWKKDIAKAKAGAP